MKFRDEVTDTSFVLYSSPDAGRVLGVESGGGGTTFATSSAVEDAKVKPTLDVTVIIHGKTGLGCIGYFVWRGEVQRVSKREAELIVDQYCSATEPTNSPIN
jgi:hypothetical protein